MILSNIYGRLLDSKYTMKIRYIMLDQNRKSDYVPLAVYGVPSVRPYERKG